MDKEIIKHIVAQLHSHEELYSDGAWERFSAPKRKKRRVIAYWPLWGAAALILVTAGIYFGVNNYDLKTDLVVKHHLSKTEQTDLQQDADVRKQHKSNDQTDHQMALSNFPKRPKTNKQTTHDAVHRTVGNGETDVLLNQIASIPQEEISKSAGNLLENHIANNTIIEPHTSRDLKIVIEKKRTMPKSSFEALLAKDSHATALNPVNKKSADSKWSPGVYVAPAMGNDNKVNMNYGFSLAYNVVGKFSISSGVAYTALSSTSNPSSGSSATMASDVSSSSLTRDSKNLESVDAQLRGINIPLELKYSFSDKFYTGIGVSALAILNNRQENNYIINQAQNTTVLNTMGYAEQKMLLVTQRVSEPQAESVVASEKYLGFYNFSLGYKQKISPKKNIAIEPFLRLPMKTFSKDNLNLTNGGLRIKVDF